MEITLETVKLLKQITAIFSTAQSSVNSTTLNWIRDLAGKHDNKQEIKKLESFLSCELIVKQAAVFHIQLNNFMNVNTFS